MSPTDQLTAKQKRLVRDLRYLYSLVNLDFYDIRQYPKEWRTARLEVMWRDIVREEIVTAYTYVDEILSCVICDHFFGTKRSYQALWKTKKFQVFNACFIDEVSLVPKLKYVKALKTIPKPIAADIERLNAIRNAMAHAFFPENVKRSQALWKDQSVFTRVGFDSFHTDILGVNTFLRGLLKTRLRAEAALRRKRSDSSGRKASKGGSQSGATNSGNYLGEALPPS